MHPAQDLCALQDRARNETDLKGCVERQIEDLEHLMIVIWVSSVKTDSVEWYEFSDRSDERHVAPCG